MVVYQDERGPKRQLVDALANLFVTLRPLTPDAGEVFGVKGFAPWWERMQALPSYESTAPQLG